MDHRRTASAPPPETVSSLGSDTSIIAILGFQRVLVSLCLPVPILEVERKLHGLRLALCTYRTRLRREEVPAAATSNDAFVDRVYIPPMFRERVQEEKHVLRCEFGQRMHALPQRRNFLVCFVGVGGDFLLARQPLPFLLAHKRFSLL